MKTLNYLPLAALLCAAPAAQAQTYTVTDLGALSGYPSSYGYGINNSGQVALTSSNSGNFYRAFTSSVGGTPQILATQQNMSSFANGINNNGAVVGNTTTESGDSSVTVWNSQGVAQVIGTGSGNGINDSGVVVGGSYTSGNLQAFVYTPSTGVHDIGTFDGSDSESQAYAVNNAGQVAGYSETASKPFQAFVWKQSTGFTDLGTLNGYSVSAAYGLSATGEAVGFAGLSASSGHAFSWSASDGMTDLGALGPNDASTARGVNDLGQIVGNSVSGNSFGFLFTHGSGMVSLDSLLAPASQGWVITNATGINDAGQIVADGYSLVTNETSHGLLLTPATPVPETSTTVSFGLLLALGAGAVAFKKKRRA